MWNGYFEIRLVRVSKQKGENKNTNPKPINSNNNTKSSLVGGVGGWYNCEFRVIPLPTRAQAGKGWLTHTSTRALACLGIDNYLNCVKSC